MSTPTGTAPWTSTGNMVYLPLVLRSFPLTYAAPVLNTISSDDHDGEYTVSWSSSDGADTYTLQDATNASFSGATTVYSDTNTSTVISGRDVGTYHYRVPASNACTSRGWSNVQPVAVTVSTPIGAMVEVPAGSFQGGYDPAHDAFACAWKPENDLPLHAVYLNAHRIDRAEVTSAQ